jgi:hypothetical protein
MQVKTVIEQIQDIVGAQDPKNQVTNLEVMGKPIWKHTWMEAVSQ